jgi:hypothetical protein
MTRNILSLILLTTLAAAVPLNAEPTPSAERTPSRKAVVKVVPAPSAEGWSYLKGEWIHSDGYKYVKGQVIRTGAQTHKSPPKPPSKALLDSVKTKPTPSPNPNSTAAKAAEERAEPQAASRLANWHTLVVRRCGYPILCAKSLRGTRSFASASKKVGPGS